MHVENLYGTINFFTTVCTFELSFIGRPVHLLSPKSEAVALVANCYTILYVDMCLSNTVDAGI